ncbi:MAG: preprotein translocase subunit SecG [Desulfobacterales bacterium]|jgi:preprotein translocase subunit SecG
MSIFLIVIHVIVCIALIMIVLLQTGKGADMGAAFGGGSSQTLFGSTGASTFLSKATTAAAIIFMVTSLGLAYMSSHRTGESVVTGTPAPVESPAAPGTTTPPATGSGDAPSATGSGDAPSATGSGDAPPTKPAE